MGKKLPELWWPCHPAGYFRTEVRGTLMRIYRFRQSIELDRKVAEMLDRVVYEDEPEDITPLDKASPEQFAQQYLRAGRGTDMTRFFARVYGREIGAEAAGEVVITTLEIAEQQAHEALDRVFRNMGIHKPDVKAVKGILRQVPPQKAQLTHADGTVEKVELLGMDEVKRAPSTTPRIPMGAKTDSELLAGSLSDADWETLEAWRRGPDLIPDDVPMEELLPDQGGHRGQERPRKAFWKKGENEPWRRGKRR